MDGGSRVETGHFLTKKKTCLLGLRCDLTRVKANMENVQDVRDLSWLYLLELRQVRASVLEHLIRPGKRRNSILMPVV